MKSSPEQNRDYSPQELISTACVASLCRRSLEDFVKHSWHIVEPTTDLVWGEHIGVICRELEKVTRGEESRLLINIPPGHMKSLIVAVFWPAWIWLIKPGFRMVFASYAANLAQRDSVRCRTLLESDWYRQTFSISWTLREDQNRKDLFENTKGGSRGALSVGGQVTGFRGNAFVCDDPMNATDATSKVARDTVLSWWDTAISSRLNDPRTGVKVVIMQRLHEDDLSGHLLRQGGYKHLCLPAQFEAERACSQDWRKNENELLFPEMFTADVLTSLKRELGSTAFAGQYQQRPQALEGGMFKREWWRFFGLVKSQRPKGCNALDPQAPPSKFDEVIVSWDCAFKGKSDSDFVAGLVLGRVGAEFYVLDLWHRKATFTQTLEAVRSLALKFSSYGARVSLIEDKANGPAIIDALKAEVSGLVAVNPEGGKESRAAAIQPAVEAGQVYLPEGASWLETFVEELSNFPRGRNDDIVDALSQGLVRMLPSKTSFAYKFAEAVKARKNKVYSPPKLL